MKRKLAAIVAAAVLASVTAGGYGALVTWNPTAADADVVAGDFDAYTSGPASWSITRTGDIDLSAFVSDGGAPADFGYAMDDGDSTGNNPAPSHIELTLDSALDFSTSAITVRFDMLFGRSGNNKEVLLPISCCS